MPKRKFQTDLEHWNGTNFVTDPTWGDNGKGKVIDLLAQRADLIIRINGGPNAGHTVINEKGEFKLHLIPSGIFNPDAVCILSDTVVVNPFSLVDELTLVKKAGIKITKKNFLISQNAHLILPWHNKRDSLRETSRGKGKIGTTGQGIGPAYSDRTERVGLRVGDLLSPHLKAMLYKEIEWQEKLTRLMSGQFLLSDMVQNSTLSQMSSKEIRSVAKKQAEEVFYQKKHMLQSLLEVSEILAPFISNVLPIIWEYHDNNKRILGEAGQGLLLDLDRGNYPGVTSSHPGIAGFNLATGIDPTSMERVVGVTKAYATRVGEGPLPTELADDVGDAIRKKGREFGATTGRPRRCGWLDIPAIRYGCRVGGINSVALTKIDIFDGFPEIKICVGYKLKNKEYLISPTADVNFMEQVTPVYETVPGWDEETSALKNYKDLPKNAKKYIERIETLIGIPVELVSVSPHRDASIYR